MKKNMSLFLGLLIAAPLLLTIGCDQTVTADGRKSTSDDDLPLFTTENLPILNTYYLGHSLISDIPDIAMSLLNQYQANSFNFDEQEIPGAALSWHWDRTHPDVQPPYEPYVPHPDLPQEQIFTALDGGNYPVIVITDSVPRGPGSIGESVDYMGRILARARAGRSDVKLYYYETWHHSDSGTQERINNGEERAGGTTTAHLPWIQRVRTDAAMWDSLVNQVNANHPAGSGQHPVRLIPAGRILANLVEAVNAGEFDGYTDISDIFGKQALQDANWNFIRNTNGAVIHVDDTIHLGYIGSYAVALVHAGILGRRDPRVLGNDPINIHGGAYWDTPTWYEYVYVRPSDADFTLVKQIVYAGLQEFRLLYE